MNGRRIEGKRAIVTGAGAGIGRATALRFAREGARVGLLDRDERGIDAVAASIAAEGGESLALATDVTVENQVADAVDRVAARWGGLDIVVANAGVLLSSEDARADRLDTAVWKKTMDINLTGVFLTCKYGIRALLDAGGGSVICTASPTGLFGCAPGFDAYSASKAGVYGLVRVMASDYAHAGIRVNAVVPGFTDTPMNGYVIEDDQRHEALRRTIPLGRAGTADEVAAMMLFLASDEASYATGGAFVVDGGMTAI